MIRARTRWPHRIGGLTFYSREAGFWRRNLAGNCWAGEGALRGRISDDWGGPGYDRRITWWRNKLARRMADDRAAWRGEMT